MSTVYGEDNVTTLPSMLVTKIVSPEPLFNAAPIAIFCVSLNVIVDTGAVNEFVIFRVVLVATTPVTCVPAATPVPDKGAPIGGNVDDALIPKVTEPDGVEPSVAKLPADPFVSTENVGDVPISAPV